MTTHPNPCRVRRCDTPAAWRVHFTRTSPVNPRPFAADYCATHAAQQLDGPHVAGATALAVVEGVRS